MSSEITSTDYMFSVGETPWHKHGHVLPRNRRILTPEALPLAFPRVDGKPGTWDVTTEPARVRLAGSAVDQIVPGYKCIIRDDTREVLAIMTDSFRELSNLAAFAAFDRWVEQGLVTYETAGSLRGGRRVWILARLAVPDLEIGSGDKIAPYALLAHGHDGSLAIRVKMTMIRVVCANTLAAALWGEGSLVRAIRHTGDVSKKAADAVANLDTIRAESERTAERYRKMAQTPADMDDVARYLAAVYKRPLAEVIGDGTDPTTGKARRPMQALDPIGDLFEAPRGRDLATTNGTVWGLYQALTAYMTHGKADSKRTEESRFDSVAFNGDGERMSRGEIVADLLASVGLGRAGLTWEDLTTTPTDTIAKITEAKRAA